MSGGRARRLLGVLISLVAVTGCAVWAAGQEAPTLPGSGSGLALVALALGVYAAATVARGWRWDVVLRHAGVDHRRADAYGLIVVGYMGNTVLPARGGEVLRILLLSERTSARRREVLGAILPERMLDAAALAALFATLTFAGVAGGPARVGYAIGATAVLAGGVVALAVYLRLRIAGRLEGFAARVRPVARASRLLLTRWGAVLLGASVAVWLAEALVMWLVTRSLDVRIDLLEALLVVILGSFLALVPAAPGYVGTYDAAILFGLAALDVRGGGALSVALLFRFVVFVPITLAGLGLMVTRYGGLAALRARGRRADPPASADGGGGIGSAPGARATGSHRG